MLLINNFYLGERKAYFVAGLKWVILADLEESILATLNTDLPSRLLEWSSR